MGNMLIGKSTGFPYDLIQKETTDEVLAPLAQKIHELASEPHGKKGMLITSNHSRFAHYEVDFGSGAPAIVRHVPLTVGTYAYIMPTNPKLGGYEVELKLTPDEMDNVIQNTNWMNLVDSYERCP
ncbi:hypothetical protein GGH99_000956 [Coemansia sp. RSA 1285]|nr:hypothetical protein GGH99_000956 [Coemansia sp. RSA 1285]